MRIATVLALSALIPACLSHERPTCRLEPGAWFSIPADVVTSAMGPDGILWVLGSTAEAGRFVLVAGAAEGAHARHELTGAAQPIWQLAGVPGGAVLLRVERVAPPVGTDTVSLGCAETCDVLTQVWEMQATRVDEAGLGDWVRIGAAGHGVAPSFRLSWASTRVFVSAERELGCITPGATAALTPTGAPGATLSARDCRGLPALDWSDLGAPLGYPFRDGFLDAAGPLRYFEQPAPDGTSMSTLTRLDDAGRMAGSAAVVARTEHGLWAADGETIFLLTLGGAPTLRRFGEDLMEESAVPAPVDPGPVHFVASRARVFVAYGDRWVVLDAVSARELVTISAPGTRIASATEDGVAFARFEADGARARVDRLICPD